jgi:DNA-binding MarR family transcriptional regulator
MKKTASGPELVFEVLNEIGIIQQLAAAQLMRLIGADMGVSEFSVLNHFVRLGDGKTPSMLARAFQLTKPSMTAILGKLEAKGYVRIEAVKEDRRSKHVYITAAGRKARDRAVAATAPMAAEILKGVGGETFKALQPRLAELRAWLDAERNERDGF